MSKNKDINKLDNKIRVKIYSMMKILKGRMKLMESLKRFNTLKLEKNKM